MEPKEFSRMVNEIRNIENALGSNEYKLSEKVLKNRQFSRSLYVVENVNKGDIISEKNVRSIRPGFGMKPKFLNDILGKKFNKKIEKGTSLNFEMII